MPVSAHPLATPSAHDHVATAAEQQRLRKLVRRVLAKQSYCTLATASKANRPHVAGVLYAEIDGVLYIDTYADSRKARNIAETGRAAVCVPIRKIPVGPPFSVQFQATAEVLASDSPEVTRLLSEGRLKPILVNGGLAEPGGCVLKITTGPRVATYGLGVPLWQLIRDPLSGSRTVEMTPAA